MSESTHPADTQPAKASDGECGRCYFHSAAGVELECCRPKEHPGCHEGFTGNERQPRDCEWRWWDDPADTQHPEDRVGSEEQKRPRTVDAAEGMTPGGQS